MRITRSAIAVMLSALLSLSAGAQSGTHAAAEKALERIVLERDFGADLKFHSREVVTFNENAQVPGLYGLMFMRWRGAAPDREVTASVQWFEDAEDLLPFYLEARSGRGFSLLPVDDTLVWTDRENAFLWTDGEHFVVGLIGSPAPPREMIKAWLAMIESRLPDLARVPGGAR